MAAFLGFLKPAAGDVYSIILKGTVVMPDGSPPPPLLAFEKLASARFRLVGTSKATQVIFCKCPSSSLVPGNVDAPFGRRDSRDDRLNDSTELVGIHF